MQTQIRRRKWLFRSAEHEHDKRLGSATTRLKGWDFMQRFYCSKRCLVDTSRERERWHDKQPEREEIPERKFNVRVYLFVWTKVDVAGKHVRILKNHQVIPLPGAGQKSNQSKEL